MQSPAEDVTGFTLDLKDGLAAGLAIRTFLGMHSLLEEMFNLEPLHSRDELDRIATGLGAPRPKVTLREVRS